MCIVKDEATFLYRMTQMIWLDKNNKEETDDAFGEFLSESDTLNDLLPFEVRVTFTRDSRGALQTVNLNLNVKERRTKMHICAGACE